MTNLPNTVSKGLIDITLSSAYGAELGSGANTHEPVLRFIGQLVQHTQNEDLISAIVEARLPDDYSGNTLKEVPKMIESAIEKGFDQPSDNGGASQPKQSTEAMAELKSLGMTLFYDKLGKTYATFDDFVNGCVVVPLDNSEMKERIQFAYFEANGKALAQSALTEVVDTLKAQARFRGTKEEIHLRIGGYGNEAYIDRGTDEKSFIRFANGEWTVVDKSPIKFRRSPGCKNLPNPTRDAEPIDMQELLGLDDDAQIFQHIRPVAMNGIGDYAYRPDLLERSILIKLSPILECNRKTEREMDALLEKLLPGFLGYLYDCAAHAMDNLNKVDPPRSIRMADAAHFVVAAEPATGFKQGQFLQALEQVRDEIMIDRVVNDSLSLTLQKVLNRLPKKEFDGLVSELFDKIADATSDQRIALPKSPSSLSNSLKRSQPMLAKIGLMVEFTSRSNQGRNVRVWMVDNEHRIDHDLDGGHEI